MKNNYILLLVSLLFSSFCPMGLYAQEAGNTAPEDSCTMYISYESPWANYYTGKLQLLHHGQVIATLEEQEENPWSVSNPTFFTVPADVIDFNWNPNVYFPCSFDVYSNSGEILFSAGLDSPNGIVFSLNVCTAPKKVSNFIVTPATNETFAANLSWTNPILTVNNDTLQGALSIILFRDGDTIQVLQNQIPGASVNYTDTVPSANQYIYSILVCSENACSLPEMSSVAISACQYKLVLYSNNGEGWRDGYLDLGVQPHYIASLNITHDMHQHFSLQQPGTETIYLFLPKGWIEVEHWNIHSYDGLFTLYDENDNLIFSGPDNLSEKFQWYNGCSLDIPDTVTSFNNSVQGNVVHLDWTNPTTTVDSDTLATISKIEIRRNEELIHTFTGAVPGGQLSFSDTMPEDGTYIYSVQCFNEAGGGVPSLAYVVTGSNWVLHNSSNNGNYADTTCSLSISNDDFYTYGGRTTLTVYQSDTTKLLKISGHASQEASSHIQVYAGTPDNGILLSSDTVTTITPYHAATFILDIPVNSSPQFHYTVECVNSVYEQPDTSIAIVPDSNSIIYVTQDGAGLRNGSSWANATPWLNRALSAADTMTVKPIIWVAQGTYYGSPKEIDGTSYSFVGYPGVNVYGGFVGNEPSDYNLAFRDFEQNETILDGLLYHSVVFVNAEWNGFHIKNGTNGCKLPASSILRKCRISNCLENGVTNNDYYALIDSCTIDDNNGDGIAMRYALLTNSKIAQNGRDGISVLRGIIHNCSVTQNGGNGIYIYNNVALISNSLIANNDQSGVVFESGGSILTTTITNNIGDGVVFRSDCQFRNSIIYGNGGISIANNSAWSDHHEIVNCAIEGDYPLSSQNNISLDSPDNLFGTQPGFVNPTAGRGKKYGEGDYHLLPTSVCINRGKATFNNVNPNLWYVVSEANQILKVIDSFPPTDLDGDVRIQQGTPDIGAYESFYVQAEENLYIHPDSNHILYVKENGNGDGSSWQNATSNLAKAIEIAWLYGPSTQIWVAQGTYPTEGVPYYLKENMKLFGGFEGDEPADYPLDSRNTIEHATILDGQQQNRVLDQTIDFDQPAVVDGFTLTRGKSEDGAGAYLMAKTTLSKCRIVNNTVTNANSAVVTVKCDTLKQLIVENNEGTGISAASSHLLHCTVVKNNGYGIHLGGNTAQDSSCLYNSIIWNNALQNLHFTTALMQDHSPVNNCAIEEQIVKGTDNNISLSSNNTDGFGPYFVFPTDTTGAISHWGEWRLDSLSVCVNGGINLSDSYGMSTDIAGNLRVQNGKADIGAWESSYQNKMLCRNIEAFIYEGEIYPFYDTNLTTGGWYVHRWKVGDADSVVTLHLITKQVVYVSVAGAGNMDGSSWDNALDGQTSTTDGSTKLADALQTATAGTEFWIQSGTYYACSDSDVNKSLILNSGVGIYGGFVGTETTISQRDTTTAQTVFSGKLQNDTLKENHTRTILKTNEKNTPDCPILLDNITITEGYNDINVHEGCALRINASSSVKASNCRIHHNFGGAIVNEGLFSGYYCTIDSNESYCDYWDSDLGAAALINRTIGLANLTHCIVAYNKAPSDGAIFNNGVLLIDSSLIEHNTATTGSIGAIRNESGVLTILNSHLSYNKSYQEFSAISSSGLLKMDNCTFEYNQTNLCNPLYYWPGEMWAAIYSSAHVMVSGDAEIAHCLFRGNTQNAGNGGGCLHVDGNATIRHCDFIENFGAGNSASSFVTWGDGNSEPSSGGLVIITIMETGYIDGGGVHVSGNGEVYVEDCLFDRQVGKHGSSASVSSGKLTMNRCQFTRNIANDNGWGGVLSIQGGELHVMNSLFANNQDVIFNTEKTVNSKTTFTNCTFANNGSRLCFFAYPMTLGCDASWVNDDTAHVNFDNCIITGGWDIGSGGESSDCGTFYPNFIVNFSNTLFDTINAAQVNMTKNNSSSHTSQNVDVRVDATNGMHVLTKADAQRIAANQAKGNLMVHYDAERHDFVSRSINVFAAEEKNPKKGIFSAKGEITSDCTPDSLGNIYYCDPMFVNPTTVVGVDSAQNPLLFDFRLQEGSPCINTGDTAGLNLTADATDLDGERRVKQCKIDRGCYEYGTTLADTTVIAVNSFTWRGNTYTESGDYPVTVTEAVDCDNVVTLHLTVITPPVVETSGVGQTGLNTAEGYGTILSFGGADTVTYGICWGTEPDPTVNDSHSSMVRGYTQGGEPFEFSSEMTGLSPNTTYYVRAYAYNEAGLLYGESVSFTVCNPISVLPYTEDFEGFTESMTAATGVEPTCWELVQEDVAMPDSKRPQLYYKSSYAHSGNYSLLLNYCGIYAMPTLPSDVAVNTLKLDMYLRQAKSYYQLQVGVWEDNGTFTPVALINNSSTEVEHVECDFSAYPGNGHRIAFRNVLSAGTSLAYSYNYIDDISLSVVPVAPCEDISLPYSQDFDSFTTNTTAATGVEPTCWELVHGDVTIPDGKQPQLYYKSDYAHSGNYSLLLNYRCIYAMPELAEGISINTLRLEMYVRQPKSYYQLQVGVWEDDSSFVPVSTINNSTTGVEYVEVDFSTYTGTGHRIAFRNVLPSGTTLSYSYNYIDDITVKRDCRIKTIPYTESFENYTGVTTAATGVEPYCWDLVQSDVTMTNGKQPQLYYKSDYAHSGNYSLLLNYRGIYALPPLSENIALNSLKLEMYVRQPKSYYQLQVGVWEDNGTFIPMATFNNSTTGVEHVECDFTAYSGNGHRIAFRNVLPAGTTLAYSYNYIDDISLSVVPVAPCEDISLPYSQDFDSFTTSTTAATGVEPTCWELVHEDVTMPDGKKPQLYYSSSYAHSGNYSLLMNYRGIYAMPALPSDVAVNTLKLDMYLRQAKSYYQLQVGVWEDNGTFTPVALINNSSTEVEHVECDFSAYPGNGHRIAFRNVLSAGTSLAYSYNYIDDISLSVVPVAPCEDISLPYSQDFDSFTTSTTAATGVEPTCWELVHEDVTMPDGKKPQLYYSSSYAHSGNYSLLMNYRGIYAMPALPSDVAVNTLKLDMYLRQAKSYYQLQVGVWEDNGTFTPVALINNSSTDVEHVECDFSTYPGSGHRIAFRNVLPSGTTLSYSYNYIDDISLSRIPDKIEEVETGGGVAPGDGSVADDVEIGTPMGVDGFVEDLGNITVYPNPTTGQLHIDAIDVTRVECYSQMGQLVAVFEHERDIDISHLSSGVYMLRVTLPQGVAIRKVVKK